MPRTDILRHPCLPGWMRIFLVNTLCTVLVLAVQGGVQAHGPPHFPTRMQAPNTACLEYAVTLTPNKGSVPPGSTAVTKIAAGVFAPADGVWTFAAQGAPPNVSVDFVPATFSGSGETQVRINVGKNATSGVYPIILQAKCNDVAVSQPTFTLTVEGATPTPTPTNTPTATSTSTPTPTSTPTATPTGTPEATATAEPSPTPFADIRITGVEITQAIQNLANGAPLIADKLTTVRVYARSDTGRYTVRARIKDSQSGNTYVTGPIPVFWDPYPVSSEDRRDINRSFTFWLPGYWSAGSVTLDAEVNIDRKPAEADYTNNKMSVTVRFETMPPLRLRLFPIAYAGKVATGAELLRSLRYLKDTYPISRLNASFGKRLDLASASTLGITAAVTTLEVRRLFSDDSSDVIWVGYMPPSLPGSLAGKSNPGHQSALAIVGPQDSTLAHEIGHVLGRDHVDCGGPLFPDHAYPYPTDKLSFAFEDGYWGFRPRKRSHFAVRDPAEHKDFMSYCYPKWVSDYTYRGLQQAIRKLAVRRAALQAVGQTASPSLLVSGVITPGKPAQAAIQQMLPLTSTAPLSALVPGPYTLELQDVQGTALVTRTFDAADVESSSAPGGFVQLLPLPSQANKLVLRRGGDVLATRVASVQPPTVTVAFPNGGEALTGAVTVHWNAGDPDGDPLNYVVRYSGDGGATWEALAANITGTTYLLDTSSLAGGDRSLIQVIASDGFHAARDASDAVFSVARKPPQALVLAPEDGAVFPPGRAIVLSGLAADPEDGPLAGAAFTWYSDRDGPLGAGESLITDRLSPGAHTITLSVQDSDGSTTQAEVRIFVGHRLYAPLVASP